MDMETTPISRILLKLSPPVMLSLLIQSIYNIVDSFFVARYSVEGLTALSLIYPVQLLMIALATGTGLILALINFVIFAVPAGLTIAITSYLQGVARMKESVFIIVLRQVFLLVPLAWILHFFGLSAVWWTFPLTEIIASLRGVVLVTIKDKTP